MLLYITIPGLKNWRLGADICFSRNYTEFCVLTNCDKILDWVIAYNGIHVSQKSDPFLSITHNSTLLNLSVDLKV